MQPTLILVLKVFYTFCLRQLISKFLLTCESYNLPKLLFLVVFHRTLYYCRRYSRRDSDTNCGHGAARVEHPCAPAVQSRSPTQPLHGARGAGRGWWRCVVGHRPTHRWRTSYVVLPVGPYRSNSVLLCKSFVNGGASTRRCDCTGHAPLALAANSRTTSPIISAGSSATCRSQQYLTDKIFPIR